MQRWRQGRTARVRRYLSRPGCWDVERLVPQTGSFRAGCPSTRRSMTRAYVGSTRRLTALFWRWPAAPTTPAQAGNGAAWPTIHALCRSRRTPPASPTLNPMVPARSTLCTQAIRDQTLNARFTSRSWSKSGRMRRLRPIAKQRSSMKNSPSSTCEPQEWSETLRSHDRAADQQGAAKRTREAALRPCEGGALIGATSPPPTRRAATAAGGTQQRSFGRELPVLGSGRLFMSHRATAHRCWFRCALRVSQRGHESVSPRQRAGKVSTRSHAKLRSTSFARRLITSNDPASLLMATLAAPAVATPAVELSVD